jgi:ornithine cyclodeaminase/alanine dehydrogenase-like protein (mu-crystallin family)
MFATPRTELQEQLTIFSSTGHAFLDLVATAHVIQALGISPGGAA